MGTRWRYCHALRLFVIVKVKDVNIYINRKFDMQIASGLRERLGYVTRQCDSGCHRERRVRILTKRASPAYKDMVTSSLAINDRKGLGSTDVLAQARSNVFTTVGK